MSFSRRAGGALAVAVSAALVLSACGSTSGTPEAKPSDAGSKPAASNATVTFAFDQEISSYNGNTPEDYSTKNHIITQLVQSDMWKYSKSGGVEPNTDMGSYEKVSDSPLTVKYTFNPNAAWSDGKAIGCTDVLFKWAVASGEFPEFSYISTDPWDKIEMPSCKPGDKEITLKYSKTYADWAGTSVVDMPPHVVAEQGGLTVDEMLAAIQAKDHAKLKKAAEFYNKGWIFNGKLPDAKLIPSSGPFQFESFAAGQNVTLVPNPNYWGEKAKIGKLVVRQISGPEQVQALQNGEVNIIEPQANADVLTQVQGLPGVKVETGSQFLYDHLDFNFNKGVMKDAKVRQAFALCVPRQQIVDNLVKPQDPNAVVMQARNVAPFQENYADTVAGIGTHGYENVDLEKAKSLLAEAGQSGKVKVKVGYIQPNPRRAQTVELIKASCDQAGFEVVDSGSEKFFDPAGALATGDFDVALFGWAGSALVSGWPAAYKTPTACTAEKKSNNKGCYSNPEVDKLLDQIVSETDLAKQKQLTIEVEKLLWKDVATIPLFSHPRMTAWSENITGVTPNPTQASVTLSAPQWAVN
ncbi:ABC transporter family substrate-binding protein [Nonomuraea sp. NPDC050310]|uniref:ABC transporter family substrate-binding protein n=1 Tax=unclassified Nonomuraea TaxID=2593643 RepID=UPI0033F4FDC8